MNYRAVSITILVLTFEIYLLIVCWIDTSHYYKLPKEPRPKNEPYQIIVSHGSVRYASDHEAKLRDAVIRRKFLPLARFLWHRPLALNGNYYASLPTE
jgi:hypothetical protein